MLDALARLLLAILWLANLCLMLFVGHRFHNIRPYTYGLMLIPTINVVFYVVNVLWRMGFVTIPNGFFGQLSNYRNWATAANVLLVLCVFIVVEWAKQRQS